MSETPSNENPDLGELGGGRAATCNGQNELEQSFAAEDAANLAKIAYIPDHKLRGELATNNAEIEHCHRLLDEHYGLAADGMTSMDCLSDRIKQLLSERSETGWLIEKGPAYAPHYLTVHDWQWAWLPDHQTALRFSRKEDAESVGTLIGAFDRIAEHAWDNSVPNGNENHLASSGFSKIN
jgi:hypothetical protein